jgi:hypothetical protein
MEILNRLLGEMDRKAEFVEDESLMMVMMMMMMMMVMTTTLIMCLFFPVSKCSYKREKTLD